MDNAVPSTPQIILVVLTFLTPVIVLFLAFAKPLLSPGRSLALGMVLTVIWPFLAVPGYDDLSDRYRIMMLVPVLLVPFLLWIGLHKLVSRQPWESKWPMHLVVASPFLAVCGLVVAFLFGDWDHH